MRWGIIAALVLWCGVSFGQQKKQIFLLPFAKEPPLAVKRIMETAARDIHKEVNKILEGTENDLKQELIKKKGRLEEANFIQATLDIYKTWLTRNEYYRHTFSPVGTWHGLERHGNTALKGTVQFFADGTTKATWHTEPGLWTQDALGTIRALCMNGRILVELELIDENTMKFKGSLDNYRIRRIKR